MSIAMDCEMVRELGGKNIAARVSLVNERGQVVLDEYINPQLGSVPRQVTDYLTSVSGITSAHLKSGKSLSTVKSRVADLIRGKILVGHFLDHDLEALELNHPRMNRRDLAENERFRCMNGRQPASLKFLASELLGKRIQNGLHSSIEDATASMEIYRNHWN